MPHCIEINDPADPRIACYANLRTLPDSGVGAERFVVEGRYCVKRLITSPHRVLSLLVESGKQHENLEGLGDATPIYVMPPDEIARLVGYPFHRGLLACGQRPMLRPIDTLTFRSDAPPIALAILGVDLKENVGSMIRSAAALGIEHILIGPRTADPFSRRTIRVSMATVLTQNLYRLDQPQLELAALQRARRLRTIVTTLSRDAIALSQFAPDQRQMILVVGNEAHGLDPEIEQLATDRVTIPMHLGTDSLNVSVAAAIFMYELVNSRSNQPPWGSKSTR